MKHTKECEHEWKERKVQCSVCGLIMSLSDALFANARVYMEEGRRQAIAEVEKITPKLGANRCHADGCDCDYALGKELREIREGK